MNNQIFILHRKKIDKIDKEIINLLEKRFDIAKKMGEYKRKNNIPLVDKKREEEIFQTRVKHSKFSPDFTKKLFKLIILESRKVQK
jgi:chorismate mutase